MLTLTGSNTYTGGTTVSAGTLQVGNGGSGEFLGSPSVALNSSSVALVFNESDSQTYSGLISGSGKLAQTGTGMLTLLGSNTYTGSTTISAGTLQVGNGTTAAALGTGTVTDSGTLVFNLPGAPILRRRHQRQRQPDAGRYGRSDPAGQQHLQRRHDDLGRHVAGRQRHAPPH